MYPQVPLRVRYDLFTGQIAHVFVADFRKIGKERQVAVVFVFGTPQSCRLKNPQFLLAEKSSRFPRSGIAVKCERIPRHKTVVERNSHHVVQTIYVAACAARLQMADSFQIDVVLLDERLFQFEQRNMVEVVLVFQKGPEMPEHRPIAPPGTFRAIYADTFEKIIRVMFENLRKSPRYRSPIPSQTFLTFFGRDVGIVIANRPIMFADLDADIVQMAVDAFRLDALAFDPSLL